MWIDDYDRNKKRVRGVSAKEFAAQMKRVEKEAPAIAAAVNFLALSLADQINQLDQQRRNGQEGAPSVLHVIPPTVINFALTTSLIPSREWLCEQLNKWAASVHFRKLQNGILEEPAHFCD